MVTIDRYLLRQFFWILLIFGVSFIGLYVVADTVNNFEELSDYAEGHGGLLLVLSKYYGYRAVAFLDEIAALLVLIAAMFTVAAFRRHNEMTALLAAGVSKSRLVRPIILAAVVLTFVGVANREALIPAVRDHLSYNAQDLQSGHTRDISPRYDNDTNILLGGSGVNLHEQTIDRPSFFLPPALSRHGRQLIARQAVYLEPTDRRPGGYLLSGVERPEKLDEKPSIQLGDQSILFTPHDTPWLGEKQCFIVSRIDFEQLAGGRNWREFSSTPELIAGLRNPSLRHGADVQVEVHSRLVRPLLDLTLLFLGLPLMLSRRDRNLFVAVGLCILVVVLFTVVILACQYLGSNKTIHPALAAWLPLILFVPVAVFLAEPFRE